MLRDQWGWDGFVTSDCGAIGDQEFIWYVAAQNSGGKGSGKGSTPTAIAAAVRVAQDSNDTGHLYPMMI